MSMIEVDGVPELRRGLARVRAGLSDTADLDQSAAAVALPLARSTAPRRTGRLAATGRVDTDPQTRAGRLAFGGHAADYALPVHAGVPARNMPPRPWALAAMQATERQQAAVVEDGIEKLLARVRA